MFKKMAFGLLVLSLIPMICASSGFDLTELVHTEMANCYSSNLSLQTHPTIYNMVQELAVQAQVAMPEYISVYSAEYNVIGEYGKVYREVHDLNAYVDIMGDIYICREVLTSFSYEEIQAVVALALAQKASNKSLKLAAIATSTVGLTLGTLYFLNKKYDLDLITKVEKFFSDPNHRPVRDLQDRANIMICGLFFPAIIATKLYANNLQKQIDLQAADLVGSKSIVNSIKAVDQLRASYEKEDFWSRFATRFNLKSKFNRLFYPIRSYTKAERIAYLQEINQ